MPYHLIHALRVHLYFKIHEFFNILWRLGVFEKYKKLKGDEEESCREREEGARVFSDSLGGSVVHLGRVVGGR